MNMMRQEVGITVVEWQEDEPLVWEMCETRGEGKHASEYKFHVDLTPLLTGYSQPFLVELKEVILNKRLDAALISVRALCDAIRLLLLTCQEHFAKASKQAAIAPVVFARIDTDFLLGLGAIQNKVPQAYLVNFKSLYNAHRNNPAIFSPEVHPGDIPMGERDIQLARKRKTVVASAMTRAVLVHILNVTEAAFEASAIDLGIYAFSRLMFCRAARPETYRLLRCKDLRIDDSSGTKSYFLTLTIPKAKTTERPQATVAIPREVGQLLEKQREAVVRRLGYFLVARNAALSEEESQSPYTIGDLPLFPVRRDDAFTYADATIKRLGMHEASCKFTRSYVDPIKALTGKELTCTAMRHTLATQLAIAGCSAGTIAAVLLHANDRSARVYVDLIFEGAIDELSASMETAFTDHFPVFKKFVSSRDVIEPESRIVSCSADRTRHETTGACGRNRICEYAPLSCYGCHLFKPAYDVDHTINLDLVTEEIKAARWSGLQRQNDVKRYTHIANRIRIVINVCELKLAAVAAEHATAGTAA